MIAVAIFLEFNNLWLVCKVIFSFTKCKFDVCYRKTFFNALDEKLIVFVVDFEYFGRVFFIEFY